MRIALSLIFPPLFSLFCGEGATIPPVGGYAPEIWDLAITSDTDENGNPRVSFSFNYHDEDGDVKGGYIHWDLNYIEMEDIPLEEDYSKEGTLHVQYSGGLIKGYEYAFNVYLVDSAGNRSNLLTGYYTIPED